MRSVKLLYIALLFPFMVFSQELPQRDLKYLCSSSPREFYWHNDKMYELVDTVTITFYCEAAFYLLYDSEDDRYAVFYDQMEFNVQHLLCNTKELPLSAAKRIFPSYHLNEKNYGFSKD